MAPPAVLARVAATSPNPAMQTEKAEATGELMVESPRVELEEYAKCDGCLVHVLLWR